jgi:acetyl-CoA C-acetyltransferase
MRAKILGYAESDFAEKIEDLNLEEMVFHTVRKALKDAKINREQIDTVLQAGDDTLDGIFINHVYQVEPAGSYLKEESKVEEDGAFALFYALCRLGTGKFNTALVIGYSKSSESSASFIDGYSPYGSPEVSGGWYYHAQLDPFYLRPLGHDVTSYHALQYSAFLEKSKLTEEDIAEVVAKNKTQGKLNPNAPFAEKITAQDVMHSEYISTPLKALEIPPQTDGVTALVISTEKWAKENKRDGITITGVGTASDAYYPGYRNIAESPTSRIATEKALKMAGLKRDDIKAVELYDLFSYQEPLLYKEIFGWSYDEIKEKIGSSYTSAAGDLPVNSSGGILCAHPILAAGLSRIIQLKNTLEEKKLPAGLVHSQTGMAMQSNIIYILQA